MGSRQAPGTAEKVFGRQVRTLRGRLGISQEELGFRAGVHRTYISQIERGIKSPTFSVIRKLARGLGQPASKLIAAVERKMR